MNTAWGFKTDLGGLDKQLRRLNAVMTEASGFKTDLGGLDEQLRRLSAILCGIQPQCAGNNPVLYEWLKRISELAYQADDVIDEYSNFLVKGKIALENQPKRLPRLIVYVSSLPVTFRLRMARKFKSLKESFNQIYDEAKQLGIIPVEVSDRDIIHAGLLVQPQMSNNAILLKEDRNIGLLPDKLIDIRNLLGECVVNCFDCNEQ